MTVDPTLQTYRLDKLKQVTLAKGERSLFDFSEPPAPKVKEPIINPKPVAAKPAEALNTEPPNTTEPVKPPPPPIPLKFYGFVAGTGPRRGSFSKAQRKYSWLPKAIWSRNAIKLFV
jgi:hypothetical protein